MRNRVQRISLEGEGTGTETNSTPVKRGARWISRNVLHPTSVLIVSVPNPYHFKEILWNLFRIPDRQGHLYGWTRQTMTRLGEMVGFRLERSGGTYLHPPIPIWSLLARSIVYRFAKA